MKRTFPVHFLLFPLSAFLELITDNQIEIGQLKAEVKDKVMYTLLRKHRHQTKKSNLRSLADIGKTVTSASRLFSNQENGNTDASLMQSLFYLLCFLMYSTKDIFNCVLVLICGTKSYILR